MLISRLDELEEDTDFPVYFYQGLYDGVNKLKQVETTETKKFDDHWIFAIESYYPYVDKILRNYKSALRVEEEVVIVEKAKKTTSRTVRHLAANTHLLKLPDKDQPRTEVMPKKLLVEFSEDEFGIYENRFVATLIQRLVDFVSRRMRILEEDVNTKKIKELNNTIELSIDNSKYEINIDLRKVHTIDRGKIGADNQKLLARALELHRKLANDLNTEFMKTMRNYLKVRAAIMQT